MYYNLAYILTSLFFLSFFFFSSLSSVSLQLTWVTSRQLPSYLFLFFSRSPLNSAFEIINARIFQRAVPTKVVFVFRSRRSKVTTCSITLFVLVDTLLVSMKPLSATNVIDFLFSFSLLFFFFFRAARFRISLTHSAQLPVHVARIIFKRTTKQKIAGHGIVGSSILTFRIK